MQHHILVIDDDAAIGRLLQRVLEREGYVVHTTETGEEALEVLARHPIRLALVDKNLPGLTGFELIFKLRRQIADLPAILITAHPEPMLARTVRLQGYLAKPFGNLPLIRSTVRHALEIDEQLRSTRELDGPHGRPVVLFSDDEPLLLRVLSRAALRHGLYAVTDDGSLAPALAKELHPKVIVLDVNQTIGGPVLLRTLREDPATRDVPVVMLSGIDDPRVRATCLALGATDYFLKPFSDEMLRKIAQLAGLEPRAA